MQIGYFTPPPFTKRPLSIEALSGEFGKELHYASKGRNCLFHILQALNVKGPVLLPVYCCSTVLDAIKRLGLKYFFYDIKEEDCNADFKSIQSLILSKSPDCVVAVSMYGNPCCLPELECLCKNKGIALIDDAAQSVGAEIEGRKVMTFGDAGFFSLSPGKPFAGHMGAFFWCSQPYSIKYKKRPFLHRLVYEDYLLNRLNGLKCGIKPISKVVKKFSSYLQTHVDIAYDGLSVFEEEIIGGIIHDSVIHHTPLRTELAFELAELITNNNVFRQILPYKEENRKGIAHKYIFVCNSIDMADSLIDYLNESGIRCQKGYRMLSKDLDALPHAKTLDGRIIEIPLDPNREACIYIAKVMNRFVESLNQE